MSALAWYAVLALALWPLSFALLRRLGWPADHRLRASAALAAAWPLALPVACFGGVGLSRMVRTDASRTGVTATPAVPAV